MLVSDSPAPACAAVQCSLGRVVTRLWSPARLACAAPSRTLAGGQHGWPAAPGSHHHASPPTPPPPHSPACCRLASPQLLASHPNCLGGRARPCLCHPPPCTPPSPCHPRWLAVASPLYPPNLQPPCTNTCLHPPFRTCRSPVPFFPGQRSFRVTHALHS